MKDKLDAEPQCPAKALIRGVELVQEKWVLLIVDRLLKGPTGFNELARKAETVNVTTLSQRLALLEREGLVTKTIHSTMPPRTSYELTEAGKGLKPVLDEISTWSTKFLPEKPTAFVCDELLKTETKAGK